MKSACHFGVARDAQAEEQQQFRELISSRSAKRFIAVEGDTQLVADEAKIAEAARWDGCCSA